MGVCSRCIYKSYTHNHPKHRDSVTIKSGAGPAKPQMGEWDQPDENAITDQNIS